MHNDSDQEWQSHSPSTSLPAAPRRWPWLFLVAALAVVGAGITYGWPQVQQLASTLGYESTIDLPRSDREALPDLLATQQRTEDDVASLKQSVTDQRDQLRKIVDQLAVLASKVDALQRPVPSAEPMPSTPAEQPRTAAAPLTPRPKKPPARPPKPSGPVSTGGVPLTVVPNAAAR